MHYPHGSVWAMSGQGHAWLPGSDGMLLPVLLAGSDPAIARDIASSLFFDPNGISQNPAIFLLSLFNLTVRGAGGRRWATCWHCSTTPG